MLPIGWEDRLIPVQGPGTNGRTGLCLDPHDLCIAKLAAAREKDFRFVGALLRSELVSLDMLAERARSLPNSASRTRSSIEGWITANARAVRREPPSAGSAITI